MCNNISSLLSLFLGDAEFSTTLKYVSVVSLSNQECKITYGNQITDNMICAAGNYNEGTCVVSLILLLLSLLQY